MYNAFSRDGETALVEQCVTAILAAYVPAVFLLRRVTPRIPDTDAWLFAWNALASALSLAGVVALARTPGHSAPGGGSGMFLLNLVDTSILILHRRPPATLRVFYHWLTAVYCWSTVYFPPEISLWYVTTNLFAHSIMYTCFAANLGGVAIMPPILVTYIKVCQMHAGFWLNLAVAAWNPGPPTFSVVHNIACGLAMSGCYLLHSSAFPARSGTPTPPVPRAKTTPVGDSMVGGAKAYFAEGTKAYLAAEARRHGYSSLARAATPALCVGLATMLPGSR